jgi:hypothetical protein
MPIKLRPTFSVTCRRTDFHPIPVSNKLGHKKENPMTEPGTLALGEPHPAARDAFAWVKEYLTKDTANAFLMLEGFSSVGLSGNRLGEVCAETLRRILGGEPVSDRYLLGLARTLKEMEEAKQKAAP